MKVFVAGPRVVDTLNKSITDSLSQMIEKKMTVLVGDANGVDRLAQEYFAGEKYLDVCVYACNGKARNNIGGWSINSIEVPTGVKDLIFTPVKIFAWCRMQTTALWFGTVKAKEHLTTLSIWLPRIKKP